jgi:hypothetical protein
MQDAKDQGNAGVLVLEKPTVISGKPAWFEKFYAAGSQAESDRKLFAH